jgi:hypothetical protein
MTLLKVCVVRWWYCGCPGRSSLDTSVGSVLISALPVERTED